MFLIRTLLHDATSFLTRGKIDDLKKGIPKFPLSFSYDPSSKDPLPTGAPLKEIKVQRIIQ